MSNNFVDVKNGIETLPKEIILSPVRDDELARIAELLKLFIIHSVFVGKSVVLDTQEEFEFNETQVEFLSDAIERRVTRVVLDEFIDKVSGPANQDILKELIDAGFVRTLSLEDYTGG